MFQRYGDYPTSVIITRITEQEKKIFVDNVVRYNRGGLVKQAVSHTLRCLIYLFIFNRSIGEEVLKIPLPINTQCQLTSLSTRLLNTDFNRYKNLINQLRATHIQYHITSSNVARRLILWYNQNPSIAESVLTEFKATV